MVLGTRFNRLKWIWIWRITDSDHHRHTRRVPTFRRIDLLERRFSTFSQFTHPSTVRSSFLTHHPLPSNDSGHPCGSLGNRSWHFEKKFENFLPVFGRHFGLRSHQWFPWVSRMKFKNEIRKFFAQSVALTQSDDLGYYCHETWITIHFEFILAGLFSTIKRLWSPAPKYHFLISWYSLMNWWGARFGTAPSIRPRDPGLRNL